MDTSAISSVEAVRLSAASPSTHVREQVEHVQLAQVSSPKASGTGSAYSDLRSRPVEPNSMSADWVNLTRSVVDGTGKGILKPRILELEKTLAAAEKTPDSVSTERIALLMLKVSEASAITNMLSTSVNAVRRSVATLVEKTG